MPRFYPFAITIEHEDKVYTGRVGIWGFYTERDIVPNKFSVILNYQPIGIIEYNGTWKGEDGVDQELIDKIGEYIILYYQ